MTPLERTWQHLAERACDEPDSGKFMAIVEELDHALAKEEESRHSPDTNKDVDTVE